MIERLHQVLESPDGHPIDGTLFTPCKFHLSASNYRVRGYVPKGKLPERINFNQEETPYGVILFVEERGRRKDIAVGGFKLEGREIDCTQFQGRDGCYRELTPVKWSRILLSTVVAMGREIEADAIRVLPSRNLDLDDPETIDRVRKHYDYNAVALGFGWNANRDRFVLNLR